MTKIPVPPPKSAAEAVLALAAAARQATMDDAGSAFVAAHLKRTLDAVQALEDDNARLHAALAARSGTTA